MPAFDYEQMMADIKGVELQPPVLIVDDEPSNIETLMRYLQECDIPVIYAPTLSEAANLLHESVRRRPFGAVVLDNHFQDHELSAYYPNFNGIDLAVILAGMQDHFRPYHQRFADDFFGTAYGDVQDLYSRKIVLFSGSAFSDATSNSPLFGGFTMAEKKVGRDGVVCEKSLVSALEGMGYDFTCPKAFLTDYKRVAGLEDGLFHDAVDLLAFDDLPDELEYD